MKCIKNRKTEETNQVGDAKPVVVKRVKDDEAARLVQTGEWYYTTKSVYRNFLKGK